MRLSSFSGGNSTHHIGTIFNHLTGVESTFSTRKSLYNYLRILIYENTHFSRF